MRIQTLNVVRRGFIRGGALFGLGFLLETRPGSVSERITADVAREFVERAGDLELDRFTELDAAGARVLAE